MTRLLYSLLLFTLLFIVMACKKSAPNNEWSWSGNGKLSCYIDGQYWAPDSDKVVLYKFAGSYYFYARKGSQKLEINFSNKVAPEGIYEMCGSGTSNYSFLSDTITYLDFNTLHATVGRLKILEDDASHIKGLFYYNMNFSSNQYNFTRSVTQGYFNIPK